MPTAAVDVVRPRFAAAGSLAELEAVGRAPPAGAVAACNATRHLPERERPLVLRRALGPVGDRLLVAVTLTGGESADRLRPPDFRRLRPFGWGAAFP